MPKGRDWISGIHKRYISIDIQYSSTGFWHVRLVFCFGFFTTIIFQFLKYCLQPAESSTSIWPKISSEHIDNIMIQLCLWMRVPKFPIALLYPLMIICHCKSSLFHLEAIASPLNLSESSSLQIPPIVHFDQITFLKQSDPTSFGDCIQKRDVAGSEIIYTARSGREIFATNRLHLKYWIFGFWYSS